MKYSTRKEELFEQIYCEYEHDVYKLALYFVRDEHVAKDLAHKAFLNFYLTLETVKPEKIQGYLSRSVRNMAYNWLNHFKRLSEGQIDDLNDEDLKVYSVEDVYVRKYEEKIAKDLADDIMMCLYAKNKRWFEAISHAYYMDLSQKDLAKRLNVSEDVIYNRILRAKKWIRKNFGEQYEEYLKKKWGS